MTTFSFYKPEGQSSFMLNVSVEETDNLDQSFRDQEMKGHRVPGPSFARKVPNPEAFYNLLSAFTERMVQEARSCWNHMSYRQRARFGPVRWRRIVKVKAKSAQKTSSGLCRYFTRRNTDSGVKMSRLSAQRNISCYCIENSS